MGSITSHYDHPRFYDPYYVALSSENALDSYNADSATGGAHALTYSRSPILFMTTPIVHPFSLSLNSDYVCIRPHTWKRKRISPRTTTKPLTSY